MKQKLAIAVAIATLVGGVSIAQRSHHSRSRGEVGERPGVWRWDVKTASDDISQINMRAVELDPVAISKLAGPTGLTTSTPRGIRPEEKQVYSITATAVEYKPEADGDYHLILMGPNNVRFGVEVVRPDYAPHTKLPTDISGVRTTFESWIATPGLVTGTSGSYNELQPVKVTVSGVGFWDDPHGQRGMANGFEIHPVLTLIASPS